MAGVISEGAKRSNAVSSDRDSSSRFIGGRGSGPSSASSIGASSSSPSLFFCRVNFCRLNRPRALRRWSPTASPLIRLARFISPFKNLLAAFRSAAVAWSKYLIFR